MRIEVIPAVETGERAARRDHLAFALSADTEYATAEEI
jgi:hypothetical protein